MGFNITQLEGIFEILRWENLTLAEMESEGAFSESGDPEAYDDRRWIRVNGDLYLFDDFSRIIPTGSVRLNPYEWDHPEVQGWDGYLTESHWSGVLVRWAKDDNGDIDPDAVEVGLFTC